MSVAAVRGAVVGLVSALVIVWALLSTDAGSLPVPAGDAAVAPGSPGGVGALHERPGEPDRSLVANRLAESAVVSASTEGGLVVTVRDEQGAAISGIAVDWLVDADPSHHVGHTDTRGWFVVDLPAGRSFVVTVAGQTREACSDRGPARVDFVVRHYRRIAVVVADAGGTPLADAVVQLGTKSDGRLVDSVAVTDSAGRAVLDSFDRRDVVSVAKAGWRPTHRMPVTLATPATPDAEADAAWELRIVVERLSAADVLPGRVVDQSGRPVADVAITWLAEHGAMRQRYLGFLAEHPAPFEVRSDERGGFLLPLCGSVGRLLARKDGYADSCLDLDPADYEVAGVAVVMLPEAIVRGIVVDQAGMPARGAQVAAGGRAGEARETLTDALGRFELRGVAVATDAGGSTTVRIFAFHPGHGADARDVVVPAAGAVEVNLALAGNLVQGTVTRGGSAVVDAEVSVSGAIHGWRGGQWDYRGYSVRTNAPDGSFTIVRPEGRWELVITAPGGSGQAAAPLSLSGATVSSPVHIDLARLESGRGTVRIAVVDDAAQPFPNYWLRLFPAGGGAPLSLFCSARDGRLDASVPAGDYSLALSPRGGALTQAAGAVTVVAGQLCDAGIKVVEPPAVVRGTLLPTGGEQDTEVIGRISLETRAPSVLRWSGPFGAWEIPGVAPGDYTVVPDLRSGIDFEPVAIRVPSISDEPLRLLGRPCWRGRLNVRLPEGAGGPWLLRHVDCRGQLEQRTFDAGSAHGGVCSLSDVHLSPGAAQVFVGPVDGELRAVAVNAVGAASLWVDVR